jgi:hypothetical protein
VGWGGAGRGEAGQVHASATSTEGLDYVACTAGRCRTRSPAPCAAAATLSLPAGASAPCSTLLRVGCGVGGRKGSSGGWREGGLICLRASPTPPHPHPSLLPQPLPNPNRVWSAAVLAAPRVRPAQQLSRPRHTRRGAPRGAAPRPLPFAAARPHASWPGRARTSQAPREHFART